MHDASPTVLPYVPLGHGRHDAFDTAPLRDPYVPIGQKEQLLDDDAPTRPLKVPYGQAVQTLLPLPEYVPGGHRTHDAALTDPETLLNEPAGQSEQFD